jgi:hypothetical protein
VPAAGGAGAGVGAAFPEGTGTGVAAAGGTGEGVQPARVGPGEGAPDGTGTGVLALVGLGTGEGAPDGTGTGVAVQRGWLTARAAAGWVTPPCLMAPCLIAESSPAAARWPPPPDVTARAVPPASRAAAGSPSQAIVRGPGVFMRTSSSGRPGWPAIAVGTCGRRIWLHGQPVRYATPQTRPPGPELGLR